MPYPASNQPRNWHRSTMASFHSHTTRPARLKDDSAHALSKYNTVCVWYDYM